MKESNKKSAIIIDIKPYPKASSSLSGRKREQGYLRIYTNSPKIERIEGKTRALLEAKNKTK